MSEIAAKEVTKHAMLNGNKDKYKIIINDGFVLVWAGVMWLEMRKATPGDHKKYPIVVHNNDQE